MVLLAVVSYKIIKREATILKEANLFVKTQLEDTKSIYIFAVIGFMTGFVPACIGAGPGLFILVPMFALGIPPKIAVTTANFIIFLSALPSILSFSL